MTLSDGSIDGYCENVGRYWFLKIVNVMLVDQRTATNMSMIAIFHGRLATKITELEEILLESKMSVFPVEQLYR